MRAAARVVVNELREQDRRLWRFAGFLRLFAGIKQRLPIAIGFGGRHDVHLPAFKPANDILYQPNRLKELEHLALERIPLVGSDLVGGCRLPAQLRKMRRRNRWPKNTSGSCQGEASQ